MAVIESGLRLELTEGLKNDLYDFWFVENKIANYEPMYRKFFMSKQAPTGDEGVVNSALFNVQFKETAPKESIEFGAPTQGRMHPYKLKRFTAAQEFDRDLIEKDSKKPELRAAIQRWIQAAAKKAIIEKEIYFHKALNKGALSAGHDFFDQSGRAFEHANPKLLYDGKPLFNLAANARTLLRKPNNVTLNEFYNSLGTSGVSLNASNFNTAYTLLAHTNAYDDEGSPAPQFPTHVIVPPALYIEVHQVLKTLSGLPGEVNNGFNPFVNIAEPVVDKFIESATAWYLFSQSDMWEAFDQEAPIFDQWFDQEKKCYKISIDLRYGHRIMSWRNIVAANLATS